MNGKPGTGPEQWLDLHGDALFAYASLRVGDRSLAEDLVQDTLLAAIGASAGFRGEASERTWLVGILKNKIVDHIRKAGRERAFSAPDGADEAFDAQFDPTGHWARAPARWRAPDLEAENAELRAALATCVERLPDSLRAAFVLREIDGYEGKEVVDMLGISSANNLWVMLSRARERVRRCMDTSWFSGAGR